MADEKIPETPIRLTDERDPIMLLIDAVGILAWGRPDAMALVQRARAARLVERAPLPVAQPDAGWKPATGSCRKCRKQGVVEYRVIDNDHGDEDYRCTSCGTTWGVDGIDS
jgi:hypothetical protein